MDSRVRSIAAVLCGVLLLVLSQMGSENLSRAGEYRADPALQLILPEENAKSYVGAPRVTPEYSNVPGYFYDDPDPKWGGVFETRFSWKTGDPQPALLMAYFRRLDWIELNGQPVALQNMSQRSTLGGWRPVAVELDEAHLVEGENTLRIFDRGKERKVLPAFKIVAADEARSAAFAGEFFEVHLPLAVTGMMAFIAIFCAFVIWPPSEKAQVRCLIALLLIWCLRNLMGLDLFGQMPSPWRIFVAYWIGYLLAGAFAAYCFAWAGRGRSWVIGCYGVVALAIIMTFAIGYEDGSSAFEISYLTETVLVPGVVFVGIAVAALCELRSEQGRALQLLLITAAGSALALDALDERFDIALGLFHPQPMIYYATPRHGLFIALGVVGAMIYHQTRARRLSDDLAGELNRQLDQRKAELFESHEREKVLVRQKTLEEERNRIMRDMHDGLGSNLMSMLMLAKRGKATHGEYATGLQQVIDELRLMIESVDFVGDSLRSALAIFRKRVLPRAQMAGFEIDWTETGEAALPSLDPRGVLQTFRILQEAVTNALKHSEGDRVAITVDSSAEGVTISIADNGKGLKARAHGGNGISNMRSRCQTLGGSIDISDSGSGTRVVLHIPADAEGDENYVHG